MPNWTLITVNPGFPHRDSARSFEHNGRYWLSNGYQYGGTDLRDLYYSIDGINWTQRHASTPYSAYAPVVSFGGSMIALGNNGVFQSTDGGANWTSIATATYGALPEAYAVTVDDTIVMISGNDVWRSTDAVSWSSAVSPWAGLGSYNMATHDGVIYVMGGMRSVANDPPELGYPTKTGEDSYWRSTDKGVTWTEHTAPFQRRSWPGLCSHGGYLWMVGGYSNLSGRNFTDTWRSADGLTWDRVFTSTDFTSRHAPSLFSVNGVLFMCAGNRNPEGQTTTDIYKLVE